MKKFAQLLLVAGLSSLASHSLTAEEVKVPVSKQGTMSISMPKHGASKASVKKRYGEPLGMSGPVGEPAHPPITTWKYDKFNVYFEYDHVVHSVIRVK